MVERPTIQENECYNCIHLKEEEHGEDGACEVEGCDCQEWEPFPLANETEEQER